MSIAADEPTELQLAWIRYVSARMDLLDGLVTRHRERQRRYHTLAHVDAVRRVIEELCTHEAATDPGAIVAAAFYHDAIYEPTHPANERASARLARRDLGALGWAAERVSRVAAMIEGTRDHLDPPDLDSAVLYDADLAVLGDPADGYRAYSAAIRSEYRHLDDEQWRSGRTHVLQAFIDREAIYATATGRRRWEQAARTNLEDELASLRE